MSEPFLQAQGESNGDEGDRTLNPRLAKPVLSQLSYVPDASDEWRLVSRTANALNRNRHHKINRRTKIRTWDLYLIRVAL